ncbi:RipA family octameric membrane protein [Nonomuraea bangladeshensis]
MSDLSDKLWNSEVGPAGYVEPGDRYQAAVLEQYKLCVEMADRVSARRNTSNTYFLSLNTALSAALVTLAGGRLAGTSVWILIAGLVILLAQCAAWFAIVRSYRLLNSAKFAVIGALEERLPALAYSQAEWEALGEGRDWRRYLPLTHVEQWVPVIFAAAYLAAFASLLVGHGQG